MKIRTAFFLLLAMAVSADALPADGPAFVEAQGHRGGRGARPENTLPAFQFGIENGANTLELDIAVTRDNELVISHEPAVTPERCLDKDGKTLAEPVPIHSLSLAEIKTYDCGSLPNPRFPNQVQVPHTTIPRLEELFEMVEKSKLPAAKRVQFNIETKIYPSKPELTPDPKAFAQMIIDLLRKHKMVARAMLQSFDDRTLRASKKIEPRLRTSLLTSDNHVDYVAIVRSIHADILSPDHDWILPEDVQALHKIGVKVLPWTVNEPKDWEKLLAMGVDGIISDYPKELVEFLRSKGRYAP